MNFYIDTIAEGDIFNISIIDETGTNKLTITSDIKERDKIISYIEYSARIKSFGTHFSRVITRNKEEIYMPIQDDDIVFWSRYGDNYNMLVRTLDLQLKGIPLYCKSLEQEREHLGLPDDMIPRRGADEIHNTETNVEWYRKLHISLIAFERKKVTEDIFKEYDSVKQELEDALKSYELHYNNGNKNNIKLKLKCDKVPVVGNKDFYKKAILSLTVTQNNKSEIVCSKVFGFRSSTEEMAEYDWGLKLYREMLYEITGVCISTILYNRLQKELN